MLAFQEKVTPEFAAKVIAIATQLQTNPNWLMAVMKAESNLNPAAQNTKYPLSGGPATGLIQFTPDTAQALGTSIDQLKQMDGVEQLDYVQKYFQPFAGRLNSYFDTYIAVFFPAAINKPDGWIFETSRIKRSAIARQNPVIDINNNGEITVGEFKQYLYGTIPAKIRSLIYSATQYVSKNPATTIIALVVAALIIFRR